MTERQLGLRKRTRPFTAVPNDSVDDFTISFRELGLLVRLLRMPDGFVVRSEQLANEGKGKTLRGRSANREGREAVRTTLYRLSQAGYYRLVRQRGCDGTFGMATDLSEDPIEVWAAQVAVFGRKPIALVEQKDGSFLVKYPDGTLLPDDQMPTDDVIKACAQKSDKSDDEDFSDELEETPETGFRAPGNRAPGNRATGNPDSERLGAIKKMVSKDGQQDSVPASQVRPGADDDGAPDGQITITGEVEAPASGPTAGDIAASIARSWVEYRARVNKPVAGRQPVVQVRALVLPFVVAEYTETEIKKALNGLAEGLPSRGQMQRALDTIRDKGTPGGNGRPIQQRGAGSRVNDHWRGSGGPAMAGAGASVAPRADRINTDNPAW